MVLVFKRL